jgi:hypothetical protein
VDELLRILNATEEERAKWNVDRAEEAFKSAIAALREPALSPELAPAPSAPLPLHPTRTLTRPTVGQLARAQTFRFLTMIATWVLIFAALIYRPEWIRDWLWFTTHSIDSLAYQVPEPWGARLETMLELDGYIWIQIATAIVLLRLIIWVPFHLWRLARERRTRNRAGAP